MIGVDDLERRLRGTFDAVATTTRVDVADAHAGAAPRPRRRRIAMVPVAALIVVIIVAAFALLLTGGRNVLPHVRTDAPAGPLPATTTTELPSIIGMIAVASERGVPVGYTSAANLHMSPHDSMTKVNARTMWPVTDARGAIVGYLAPDLPFVPLSDVRRVGYDIEKLRAARNGGCEEQIGNPQFHQEFPPCNGGVNGR